MSGLRLSRLQYTEGDEARQQEPMIPEFGVFTPQEDTPNEGVVLRTSLDDTRDDTQDSRVVFSIPEFFAYTLEESRDTKREGTIL